MLVHRMSFSRENVHAVHQFLYPVTVWITELSSYRVVQLQSCAMQLRGLRDFATVGVLLFKWLCVKVARTYCSRQRTYCLQLEHIVIVLHVSMLHTSTI